MWWQFWKKPAPSAVRNPNENPFAIPIPEGVDPEAFAGVPRELWRSNPDEAVRKIREKSVALAQLTQRRAEGIGGTHYVWRSAGDSDVCAICASRNGQQFAWKSPPEHGPPGECDACPQGWCRCYAEVILE